MVQACSTRAQPTTHPEPLQLPAQAGGPLAGLPDHRLFRRAAVRGAINGTSQLLGAPLVLRDCKRREAPGVGAGSSQR